MPARVERTSRHPVPLTRSSLSALSCACIRNVVVFNYVRKTHLPLSNGGAYSAKNIIYDSLLGRQAGQVRAGAGPAAGTHIRAHQAGTSPSRHSGTHISRTQAGTLRYPHRRCKAVPLDRTGVRGRGDADPRHRLPVPVGATAARRTLLHTSACVETARPSFCCCSCVYPFCVSSRCCVCAAHPCSASRPLWSLCYPCRLFVRLPPSRSPTV